MSAKHAGNGTIELSDDMEVEDETGTAGTVESPLLVYRRTPRKGGGGSLSAQTSTKEDGGTESLAGDNSLKGTERGEEAARVKSAPKRRGGKGENGTAGKKGEIRTGGTKGGNKAGGKKGENGTSGKKVDNAAGGKKGDGEKVPLTTSGRKRKTEISADSPISPTKSQTKKKGKPTESSISPSKEQSVIDFGSSGSPPMRQNLKSVDMADSPNSVDKRQTRNRGKGAKVLKEESGSDEGEEEDEEESEEEEFSLEKTLSKKKAISKPISTPKSKPKSKFKPKPQPDLDDESDPEPEPGSKPRSKSKPESDVASERDSEPVPEKSEPGSEPISEAVPLAVGREGKLVLEEDEVREMEEEDGEGGRGGLGEGAAEAIEKQPKARGMSSMPLLLPEKVHATKVLVECEGDTLDFSGDAGAVGRVSVRTARDRNEPELHLDLKGVVYHATILPCATFMVINVGQSEAKVEALVNDYVVLREVQNMHGTETMVEGTLDGFVFGADEDESRPTAQKQEAAGGEGEGAPGEETNGAKEPKARRTSGKKDGKLPKRGGQVKAKAPKSKSKPRVSKGKGKAAARPKQSKAKIPKATTKAGNK